MNRQHFLVLALLVSLALNLLIAGVVIGRSGKSPEGAPLVAWATKELKPETRRLVRTHMRDQLPQARQIRRDMQQASRALRRAIGTQEYQAEALSEALEDWRNASLRYQQFLHDNLVTIAADLPQADRVALLRATMLRGQGQKLRGQGQELLGQGRESRVQGNELRERIKAIRQQAQEAESQDQ
ncbi:MAG: periplasmic heavy metal sensor [Congregibacter sp.]